MRMGPDGQYHERVMHRGRIRHLEKLRGLRPWPMENFLAQRLHALKDRSDLHHRVPPWQ